MGKAGVDIMVFGGVPLNLSMGYDGPRRPCARPRKRSAFRLPPASPHR